MRILAETTLATKQRLSMKEDELVSQVSGWVSFFDEKMSAATWAVQQFASDNQLHAVLAQRHRLEGLGDEAGVKGEDWASEREDLERRLAEANSALQTAQMRADRAATAENRAVLELRDVRRSIESSTSTQLIMRKDSALTLDDLPRILEKLEVAERRCVDISAERARAFANSARSIAFLEGESARLRQIVDHLRVVNEKLIGDVLLAQNEGIQSKSFEHRMKVALQNLADERSRIQVYSKCIYLMSILCNGHLL